MRLFVEAERWPERAVTNDILDRDGESRVCSWKCGGTGGVARLFMMASGRLTPKLARQVSDIVVFPSIEPAQWLKLKVIKDVPC